MNVEWCLDLEHVVFGKVVFASALATRTKVYLPTASAPSCIFSRRPILIFGTSFPLHHTHTMCGHRFPGTVRERVITTTEMYDNNSDLPRA